MDNPTSASEVLRLHGVRKEFGGVKAVDGVSFSVYQGEAAAVIGPNGAGKSSLFNIISGHFLPDEGEIHFDGRRIDRFTKQQRVRAGMGRSFQVASIFQGLTVRQNVQAALIARERKSFVLTRLARHEMREEADKFLELCGLFKRRDEFAASVSYGDRRMLDLALALALEPKLLLLDEPTQGIGVGESEHLLMTVKRYCSERGVTLLFTEHDMDVIQSFPTKIIVMDQGRVIASGKAEEVFKDEDVKRIYGGQVQ